MSALNLQLFAEGAAGGDAGTAGATTGVSAGVPGLQSQGDNNPLANVIYGKQGVQDANAQPLAIADANAEREAKFESLIKGEYKDLYNKRMQDTVQRRLKGSKETVDRYNALAPTLELLAGKYGVDANDIEALNKAIDEDDSYWEDEALEKGVSVAELKKIRKMERENTELKRQIHDRQAQEQAERDVANWMQEAQALKSKYPNLDLATELKNPQFIAMLKNNISVDAAYWALHHENLVPQAMQFTAKQVEQKLTNKMMANGARPTENGLSSTSPAVVKRDPSLFTKEDRQEIARRVARGERIEL